MPLPVSSPKSPVDNDFPNRAKIALGYVIVDLQEKGYLVGEKDILLELNRIGRLTSADIGSEGKGFINRVASRLQLLEWDQVYLFCERTYENLLNPAGEFLDGWYISIDEVRQYFEKEVNQILDEENLLFNFENGRFHRKGHAQTQRAFEQVGRWLPDERLLQVKHHYNKARYFFNLLPKSDTANCVKEALCALEACIEILTGKPASKDFNKIIKNLMGNDPEQIPPPIAESMLKIHAYRGSGQGVSHAALQGNRVEQAEAELTLSLVASYVTYLVSLYLREDEIPF